jgi:UDP-glucose 4-epimerase
VLVTGMGGVLGTRVAQLLEDEPSVREIVGIDFVPPRRRLRRAEFHRIDPMQRDRMRDFVLELAPTAVAHFGVYEPAARLGPAQAAERTEHCTVIALSAAARAGKLERVAVRSGLEVYGRGRGAASVPDEQVPPKPATPYGQSLLQVEAVAAGLGRRHDVSVASLRYAPIVGSHVPSPIGRLLRMPVVPVAATSDPPFQLLHYDDACAAMVRALVAGFDGPLNIVGSGAASPWQAVRLGGRIPMPVLPGLWGWAARAAELAGAAIAPHVVELLRAGCTGSGRRALDALGIGEPRSTQQVLAELYRWADIVPLVPAKEAVA